MNIDQSSKDMLRNRLVRILACEANNAKCGKVDLYKFTSKDKLRPALNGIYHKGGKVYATDGLDMVNKLEPLQASRYYDKYVYRTKENVAMACYADDVNNSWRI